MLRQGSEIQPRRGGSTRVRVG